MTPLTGAVTSESATNNAKGFINDAKGVIDEAKSVITPTPTERRTVTELPNPNLGVIPGGSEEKESLKLGSGKISPTQAFHQSPTPAFRPSSTQVFRPGATLTPTAPTGITRIQYVVKKGDTLTQIAAKFGVTVQALINENNLELSGIIKIGTALIIPVNSNRIYTIKPKETLWRIAKRYGVTIDELKDLNGIADIRKVEAGQQIILPVPVHQIKNPQF
jgi:LysM repeat protein